MRKPVVIPGLVALLLAAIVTWQVAACYIANSELQSEMNDLAVQNAARIGLASFDTEEDLRNTVIARAKEHGIQLAPEHVTVHRMLTAKMLAVSLATDYDARIYLLGFSFTIHFAPSSSHSGEIIVK